MAVIPASALRAYGVYKDPSNSQKTPQNNTEVSSGKSNGEPQIPVVQEAQAVVVKTSRSLESPQKVQPPAQVSSLLSEDGEEETPLPSREEVEGLAKRYLKVIGHTSPPKDEIKKLSDFYGASPARTSRFKELVSGLETGNDGEQGGVASVAVA